MTDIQVSNTYAVLMAEICQRTESAETEYLYNDIGPLLYAYAMPPLICPNLEFAEIGVK